MKIIKTQQDFGVLRCAKTLPAALLIQIEDYFLQLKDELEDDVGIELCLDGNGYIVVLKAEDNVRNLGSVGLNRELSAKDVNLY